MNPARRLFLICAFGSLLLNGSAHAQAPVTGRLATCGSWEVIPSANPNGNGSLAAVAAVPGSTQLWAVGHYNESYHEKTLIERWDNKSWQVIPSPNVPNANHYLQAVTALAPDDAWAVGRYDPQGGGSYTLTLHWDGVSWTIVPSPNVGTYQQLRAVAAASAGDIWAVGYHYVSGQGQQTLVEHWTGSAWTIVSSPNMGVHDNQLEALTIVPNASANLRPATVWAVGYYYREAGPPSTLIQRWDGTGWSIVPSPDASPRENYLSGVSSSGPDDVWAVGEYNTPAGLYLPLTEHWDGATWQVVPSPSESSSLTALAGASHMSAKDVWAVGYYFNPNAAELTLVQHWNGTSWQTLPSPNPAGENYGDTNVLASVASVPGVGVWAVGLSSPSYSQPQTLVEFYCGGPSAK